MDPLRDIHGDTAANPDDRDITRHTGCESIKVIRPEVLRIDDSHRCTTEARLHPLPHCRIRHDDRTGMTIPDPRGDAMAVGRRKAVL